MERSYVKLIVLLWGMAGSYAVRAQDGVLRGAVVDSATRAPLANASIAIRGLSGGARTNTEGVFRITTGRR